MCNNHSDGSQVSEQLVREAGRRGLLGSVVRPGYILGDAASGVCNNDDFLIRMLKGCIQLSSRPHIINTVNAVPVGHVSTVVVAASLNPVPAETANSTSGTAMSVSTSSTSLPILDYA